MIDNIWVSTENLLHSETNWELKEYEHVLPIIHNGDAKPSKVIFCILILSLLDIWCIRGIFFFLMEVVYLINWYPIFYFIFCLTGVHFRGKLQHFGHVSEQKMKCGPIRTQKITDIWLLDELYECIRLTIRVKILLKIM